MQKTSPHKIHMSTNPIFTRSVKSSEKKRHLHCAHMCKNIYNVKTDVLTNKRGNTLYIAVEGTDTVVNWIDNISISFKTDDIHRGFRRYADHCMFEYTPFGNIGDFDRVTVCGHSLGSACAALLVYDLCKMSELNNTLLPSNIELVLFGCPKIGGETFKKDFNRLADKQGLKVFNYQNHRDIVCAIPFGFLGYDTTFRETDTRLMETTSKPFWDLSNHYMFSYVNNIKVLKEIEDYFE